jgi:hypothetical protein
MRIGNAVSEAPPPAKPEVKPAPPPAAEAVAAPDAAAT